MTMRILLYTLSAMALGAPGASAQELPEGADPVRFQTDDGIEVHGELFGSPEDGRPLLLLFHQGGGDGRGEYAPILPRLLAEGYSAMIIDQRRGGDVFGGVNRTVAGDGGDWGYCDARPDVEGALDYVLSRGFEGPIVLWGSSYSGTLVLNLALDRPGEVDAVIAMSPASGGPLADCVAEPRASELQIPALIVRPAREAAIEAVQRQLEVWESAGHRTYVSDPGVHGSSMLVDDRVGGPTEATWRMVLGFLDEVVGGG